MANVVERDVTAVRDETDVDLGEQSNITEDANVQPTDKLTKDKDILNVLGSDSDEKTNPFKTEELPITLEKKLVTEIDTGSEEPELMRSVKREEDEEDDVKEKKVVTEEDKERRRNQWIVTGKLQL